MQLGQKRSQKPETTMTLRRWCGRARGRRCGRDELLNGSRPRRRNEIIVDRIVGNADLGIRCAAGVQRSAAVRCEPISDGVAIGRRKLRDPRRGTACRAAYSVERTQQRGARRWNGGKNSNERENNYGNAITAVVGASEVGGAGPAAEIVPPSRMPPPVSSSV